MEFESKNEMLNTLKNNMRFLDSGSQGICYIDDNTNKVYKVFYSAIEDDYDIKYSKDQILKFNYIKNSTFMWPVDAIMVSNEAVGYINNYCDCKSLYKFDPLRINLNKLYKAILKAKQDIKLLSEQGVLTYDLMYNILYSKQFKVTDFVDFSYSDKDPKILESINNKNFYYELYYFLIENYFDEFVNNYSRLNNMYKRKEEDILIFINLLKKYLSEYLGFEIKTLASAKKCLNKTKKRKLVYKRDLYEAKL